MIKDKISNHIHKPISGEWGDDCDGVNCRNVLRTTNFTHLGNVKYDEVVRRTIDEVVFQKKRLYKNDIIIEKSGGSDTIAVGRVVFFDLDDDNYTCNNFTSILRCKKTINPKYLHYCLYNNHKLGLTAYYQNKTTGIRNLQLTRYMDTEVPLFPLPQQEKIVSVLDTASALVEKQKALLKKYDLFLKSKFIEMFGDPVLNPMGWEVSPISDVCSDIVDCVNRTATTVDYITPYRMIRTTNVRNHRISLKDARYVEEDVYKTWIRRLKPQRGDLVFTREAPVGEAGIIDFDDEVFLGQRTMLFRANILLVSPYYLLFEMMGKNLKYQMDKISAGSVVKHLSVPDCKKFTIHRPPISLQNQFAQIVEQTETLKQKEQQKLEKLQMLYDALMSRAFNGEIE